MKLITPITITDSLLNFSNVPEVQPPEPDEWLNATAYDFGDEVAVVLGTDAASITHGIYGSQVEGTGTNTGNDPTLQGNDVTKWKFLRSTVRWAMFNEILQDQTILTVDRQNGLDLPGGAGNYANSPDIVFPLEKITIIAKLTPDDGTPAAISTVFSKHTESGDQRTVAFQLDTIGKLQLLISPDGTAGNELTYLSTDVSGLLDATEGWIKIEFDGDDGANSVADFYASLDATDNKEEVEWTQLGAPITDIQTSLFNSSALLELGARNAGAAEVLAGAIHRVVIYDGIDPDTWTLVSDYDRSDAAGSGISTSLATGQVWTDQGSAVFTQDIPGIIVEVEIGARSNSIALVNVAGTKIQIIMTDSADGEVFNKEFDLLSFDGIGTIYTWLFNELEFDINLVVFDLPSYSTAKIKVIITAGTTAKCGAMVVGNEFVVGTTIYGAQYGIRNYSQKNTDLDTGAITIQKATFKSVGDVAVVVDPNRFSSVLNKLTSLRDVATVWAAEEDISGTIQYGFYNSFNEIYSNSAEVVCQLSIEGLA